MRHLTAIKKVISDVEGGSKITNDPKDKGGLTKYGISQKAYPNLDIRNLSEAQAIAIYKRDYWDKIRGDEIKSYKVAYTLFNQAVNRGVAPTIRNAQAVLGVAQDGKFGPLTLNALNGMSEEDFISRFLADALNDYRAIASNEGPEDPDKKFEKGWINRIYAISDYVGIKPAAAIGSVVVVLVAGFFLFKILSSKRAA